MFAIVEYRARNRFVYGFLTALFPEMKDYVHFRIFKMQNIASVSVGSTAYQVNHQAVWNIHLSELS